MAFLGLKKGQDLEKQEAHPTKHSQEQSPYLGEILRLFYLVLATINN